MSRHSVGVEVATVSLNFDQGRELALILRELDEQVMPAGQRRHLAENGIRAGVLGTQLPAPLRLLLLEAADRREHPTAITFGPGLDQQRFIQCRSDKTYHLDLWAASAKLEVEHFTAERSRNHRFDDAVCQLDMRCRPEKNCCAALRLTPVIRHGPLRQKFVAQDGSFHMEPQRDHQAFDDLTIEFKLRAGETALVTSTETPRGVGPSFFRNAESTKQKILLIRLAQTQLDDLFSRDNNIQLAMQP